MGFPNSSYQLQVKIDKATPNQIVVSTGAVGNAGGRHRKYALINYDITSGFQSAKSAEYSWVCF